MILLGKTTKTVGLRGEIKLYVLEADLLEAGASYMLGNESHVIEKIRFSKNAAIIKFSNINSIEEAEKYLNLDLYRKKDNITLDEDEYFYTELIGIQVFDENEGYLGEVVDILQPSKQSVYVIRGEKEFLLPAVSEFVLSIDLDSRKMLVSLIEGLI